MKFLKIYVSKNGSELGLINREWHPSEGRRCTPAPLQLTRETNFRYGGGFYGSTFHKISEDFSIPTMTFYITISLIA